MPYRVVLARRVRYWVENEAEGLAARRPAAARWLRDRLATAWRLLADHPRAGRPGPVNGTRRLVIVPYVITYREDGRDIVILDIRHSRQAERLVPRSRLTDGSQDGTATIRRLPRRRLARCRDSR